jgi:hypothetical protein
VRAARGVAPEGNVSRTYLDVRAPLEPHRHLLGIDSLVL